MRIADFLAALRAVSARPGFFLGIVLVLGPAVGTLIALNSIHAHVTSNQVPGTDVAEYGVTVAFLDKGNTLRPVPLAFTDFVNEHSRSLRSMSNRSFSDVQVNFGVGRVPARVVGVHGPFFETLGVVAAAGRIFEPSDFAHGAARHAVISDEVWEREYARDPRVVGSTIEVNDAPFQIAGVAHDRFRGVDSQQQTDIWVPLTSLVTTRVSVPEDVMRQMEVPAIGRLAEPKTLAAVNHELAALRDRYTGPLPYTRQDADLVAIPGIVTNLQQTESMRRLARLWSAIALLVTFVAMLNVVTLFLSRLVIRRGEFFIRRSVGATQSTLMRQISWEAILLSSIGVSVGVLLSFWFRRLVLQLDTFSGVQEITTLMMGSVEFGLAFVALVISACLMLGSGAGFLRAANTPRIAVTQSSRKNVLIRIFGASQIALAILAVSLAGLGAQRLHAAWNQDTGISVTDVLVAHPTYRPGHDGGVTFDKNTARAFSRALEMDLVRFSVSAAQVSRAPFSATPQVLQVSGTAGTEAGLPTTVFDVEPSFFRVARIVLLAGSAPDGVASNEITISAELARALFEDIEDAIGASVYLHEYDGQRVELIEYRVKGVAAPAAISGRATTERVAYRSFKYEPFAPILIQRGNAPLDEIRTIVDGLVGKYYPGLQVRTLTPLSERLQRLNAPTIVRASTSILGALVVVALAAAGVFAIVSNIVANRHNEIALRQALGATRLATAMYTLRITLGVVSLGFLIGLPITIALLPTIGGWVTDAWHPLDYLWMFGSIGAVTTVALFASIGPMREALSAQPAALLRVD